MRFVARGTLVAVAGILAACGGGGGGGSNSSSGLRMTPLGGTASYTAGVFQPSASFAAQCAAPRSGSSPVTGQPYPDRPGSVATENHFLRSWTNELYLWYREVPDQNPASFGSTEDYFGILKTSLTTASGTPKDQFHFTFDTADWEALSQAGVEAGYGAQWVIVSGTPPRRIVVAYTEPGSPAVSANLTRGAEIIAVDGVDAVNGDTQAAVDTLNNGLFPADTGETHSFTIRELSGATRTVSMSSVEVTHTPVRSVGTLTTASGPVGYLLFNDHIATAESALINAINSLRTQNVQDLILDIRYNGGGFLDIASELAYMIGGSMTTGQVFERLVFNDKHPNTNPVTGQALTPTPFHTTTQGFDSSVGAALPTLNLTRVYVITGPNTCSASESIMNSLRGVGVQVYQIGSTTCGKPYGFYPEDNCGTTYFSIQFQGLNAQNFGDYADGFSPQNTVGARGVPLAGCSVADDFTRPLGDANEGRVAAALAFRASNNQTCPAATGFAPGVLGKPGQPLSAADGVMLRSPARENRILRDR